MLVACHPVSAPASEPNSARSRAASSGSYSGRSATAPRAASGRVLRAVSAGAEFEHPAGRIALIAARLAAIVAAAVVDAAPTGPDRPA